MERVQGVGGLGVGTRGWLRPWTRQAAGMCQEVICGGVCGQDSHLYFSLTELPALLVPRTMVAPVRTSCSSFASHSRCTRSSALIRHTLIQLQNTKILPSVLFLWGDWRVGFGIGLVGWFFLGGVGGGWVLLPFLTIYLFKTRKTQQTGRQLLQMYNPANSVK